MSTTPNEPVQDPDVVPSGDPLIQPSDSDVDPPVADGEAPVPDPTQVAETEAAEEPAGG